MTAQAPAYFRVVAIDYDGTLADGRVKPDTLAALAEARARQIRVIVVTGRILSELQAVFPDAWDHVDAIVAENGAVLATRAGVRLLAAPVGRAVSAGLAARGVAHRSGQVLVACAAADEPAASEVIRELGLDCRLVRNRGELMILPAGVTKGSGLIEALDDMGLSRHNAIGVGDAENDHSLLDACEVGVAVANAVDAIRAHADVVLSSPDGQGVAELLRGPLLAGRGYVHPRRWQLALGTDDLGQTVLLPASQLNLAICGGTGDGKSYLAGLILEQLVQLGYSLIVFDPEGDHRGLGKLHGVFVTGGQEDRLADPADVVRLLRNGYSSVVIDVSHLDADGQASYAARLAGEIEAHRVATGLPQWVAMDEAHGPVGRTGAARSMFNPAAKGYLLITWKPGELSADALASLDAVLALGSPCLDSDVRRPHRSGCGHAPRRHRPASRRAARAGRAGLATAPPPAGCLHHRDPGNRSPASRAQIRPDRRRARPPVPLPHRARHSHRGRRRQPQRTWKPSSPGATRASCATTAPATTSPAGSPTSSTTDHSPPNLAAAEASLTRRSPAAVVEQVRWRSLPRSKTGAPADRRPAAGPVALHAAPAPH